MGQGRHTLRSVSDPVYPRGTLGANCRRNGILATLRGVQSMGRGKCCAMAVGGDGRPWLHLAMAY